MRNQLDFVWIIDVRIFLFYSKFLSSAYDDNWISSTTKNTLKHVQSKQVRESESHRDEKSIEKCVQFSIVADVGNAQINLTGGEKVRPMTLKFGAIAV